MAAQVVGAWSLQEVKVHHNLWLCKQIRSHCGACDGNFRTGGSGWRKRGVLGSGKSAPVAVLAAPWLLPKAVRCWMRRPWCAHWAARQASGQAAATTAARNPYVLMGVLADRRQSWRSPDLGGWLKGRQAFAVGAGRR